MRSRTSCFLRETPRTHVQSVLFVVLIGLVWFFRHASPLDQFDSWSKAHDGGALPRFMAKMDMSGSKHISMKTEIVNQVCMCEPNQGVKRDEQLSGFLFHMLVRGNGFMKRKWGTQDQETPCLRSFETKFEKCDCEGRSQCENSFPILFTPALN